MVSHNPSLVRVVLRDLGGHLGSPVVGTHPADRVGDTWGYHRVGGFVLVYAVVLLMEVLGLNGQGKPIKDQKRWSKALETRKGSGLSLANRMSRMSQHAVPDGE